MSDVCDGACAGEMGGRARRFADDMVGKHGRQSRGLAGVFVSLCCKTENIALQAPKSTRQYLVLGFIPQLDALLHRVHRLRESPVVLQPSVHTKP